MLFCVCIYYHIFSPDGTNDDKQRRDTYQSVTDRSTISYTGNTSHREVMHAQQLSHLSKENQLIKKYLIISHVTVITTISVLFVIISDLLGFIIIDMLIQCICVAMMNKSYDKLNNKL